MLNFQCWWRRVLENTRKEKNIVIAVMYFKLFYREGLLLVLKAMSSMSIVPCVPSTRLLIYFISIMAISNCWVIYRSAAAGRNGKVHIYPIAGRSAGLETIRKIAAIAEKLAGDEKEMLNMWCWSILARNDMSRNAEQVKVEVFKELQFLFPCIHLVSKVTVR